MDLYTDIKVNKRRKKFIAKATVNDESMSEEPRLVWKLLYTI